MLTIRQCTKQYQVSVSLLQDWNRWYYKTRLLKYFVPKSSLLMVPSQTTVEQLKQQLAEAQAQYPLVGIGKLCGLLGKSRQAYYEQSWQQEK
jgi:transposase